MDKPDIRLTKVNFYHFRYRSDGKTIMPQGGITVAFRPDGKGKGFLAASICSAFDMYCKRLGRVRALGRTQSEKYRKEITVPDTYDALIVLVKQFANEVFDANERSTGVWDMHLAVNEPDLDVDLVLHTRNRKRKDAP